MRYRVQVSVYVNEYVDGTDQLQHYTQVMNHTEQTDVNAISMMDAGAQLDSIIAGIRGVLQQNRADNEYSVNLESE